MMNFRNHIELFKELAEFSFLMKVEVDYLDKGYIASFFIKRELIIQLAKFLLIKKYFLEYICGVDIKEGIMLNYHFDRFDRPEPLIFRILLSHNDIVVPSITKIFSGADWHEREVYDFFGVIFEGHPNFKPLLLPEDLGVNPLLKGQRRQSIYRLFPLQLLVDTNI